MVEEIVRWEVELAQVDLRQDTTPWLHRSRKSVFMRTFYDNNCIYQSFPDNYKNNHGQILYLMQAKLRLKYYEPIRPPI